MWVLDEAEEGLAERSYEWVRDDGDNDEDEEGWCDGREGKGMGWGSDIVCIGVCLCAGIGVTRTGL